MERGEFSVLFGLLCVCVCLCAVVATYKVTSLTYLKLCTVVMSCTALSWVLGHVFCILYLERYMTYAETVLLSGRLGWCAMYTFHNPPSWPVLETRGGCGMEFGGLCCPALPPLGEYVSRNCCLHASLPFPSLPRGSCVRSLSGLFPSSTVAFVVLPWLSVVDTQQ